MKSVVLLSGGIDSTVALAHVEDTAIMAIAFDYHQKHVRELNHAVRIADHYGIRLDIVGLDLAVRSGLIGHGDIPEEHADEPDNTFVPGRNLAMIAHGVAYAQSIGADAVVIGANADDRAGYPDCRPDFLTAIDHATRLGYGIGVHAPLLKMTKRQIVELGRELEAPLHLTWSCYRGEEHPCYRCGACQSRNDAMKQHVYDEIGCFE